MITRTFISALLTGTAMIALSGAAGAVDLNRIGIDSSGGTTNSLAITQDDTNLANIVGNGAGTGSLAIAGPWNTVSIDQQGGNNAFKGTSVKAGAGSTTASLSATYAGGKNTHTLDIGGITTPVNPQLTLNVTNNGAETNTITDTLNGTGLTYGLTVLGTGNSLTNSVAATGAVALDQTITGDHNVVANAVSGVASYSHTLSLTGSGNNIANTATTGGDKTINQTIMGDNNLVAVGLTGSGTQSASLTTDSGTLVDFTQASAAANSAATVNLSNVTGDAGAAAKVMLTQTASADGATANLTVGGGLFTMGTLSGALPGIGSPANNPGVYVYQNSPGAVLNAVVTAGSNGYTAKFVQ